MELIRLTPEGLDEMNQLVTEHIKQMNEYLLELNELVVDKQGEDETAVLSLFDDMVAEIDEVGDLVDQIYESETIEDTEEDLSELAEYDRQVNGFNPNVGERGFPSGE